MAFSDISVMKPISIDLRERILAAYDAGEGTRQQVADRFKVSLGLVKKLLAQRKRLGTIEPQYQNVGRKPAFDGEHLEQLDKFLRKRTDATLREIQEHFSDRIRCSIQAIANALKRLDWRYKKNRCVRASKTEKM
jgi:transposase